MRSNSAPSLSGLPGDAFVYAPLSGDLIVPPSRAVAPFSGRWSALRSLVVSALASVVALAAVMASAQDLYWDPNGTSTAGFVATGNWDGTTANWNTDPLGGAGGTLSATTSASNNLFFSVPGSTGTPTITVNPSQAANSLNFLFSGGTATAANNNEDSVNLASPGAITLGGGTAPGIFVAAAPSGTSTSGYVYTNWINNAITMASDLTYRNSGRLSSELKGAISGTATNLTLQNNSTNDTGVIVGGAVNITGSSAITNNGTGRGISQVNGVVSGTTNLVQDSPTSALWLNGTNTTTGFATLKQGLLILNNVNALNTVGGTGVPGIQFQGGILQYRQGLSGVTDLSAEFISNGADYKIDLTTTGATYATALAASAGAGLRKYGQAQLTLTGENTYTGTTLIGGIEVTGRQLAGGGTLTIGNGTTGSLNLSGGGTDLTFGGTGVFEVKRAAGSTQSMKQTSFQAGDGTVTSTQSTSATLTLASVSRSAGATGNFALSAGGGTPGTPGTNNIVITGQSTGAMGNAFFFGGSGYAFYDGAGFVRALDYAVDAVTADAASSGTAVSVTSKTFQQVTGAITAQENGTAFTGLNIVGAQTFTLASGATVTAGGVLLNGGANTTSAARISDGTAFRPANNSEFVVRTDTVNDQLVISNLAGNGVNALTKSGAGYLALVGQNTLGGSGITGNVSINNGSLLVASSANTSYSGVISGQGALHVAGTGALTLNGSSPQIYTGGTVINGTTLIVDFSNLSDPTNMLFTGMPGSKGTGTGTGGISLGGATGNFLRGTQGNGTLVIKGKPGASTSTYQQLGATGFAGSGGSVTVQNGVGRVLVDPNGGQETTILLSFPGVGNNGASSLVIGKAAGAGSGNVFFQTGGNSANSPTGAYGGNWGKLFYTSDGGISDLDFVVNLHYTNDNNSASLFPAGTNGVAYTDLATTPGGGTYNRLTGSALAGLGGTMTTTAAGVGVKLQDMQDGQSIVYNGGGNGFGAAGLIMTGSSSGTFTMSGGSVGGGNTGNYNRRTIFQMNPNMSLTISNVITGGTSNNALQKNGLGTVILTGANTYDGTTYINEGTLVAGSAETLSGATVTSGPFGVTTSAGNIRFSGGALGYSAANQNDYSGRFSTGGREPIKIDTAGQTVTFASTIQGLATTLTKVGNGTLVLSGANTYTGTTTFVGGNLRANRAETAGTSGPFGAPTIAAGSLVFAGGTLQYSVNNTFDYSPRFSTAAGQPIRIDTNSQNVAFATALSSPGGTLTKAGDGTLTLSAVNTYTGVTSVVGGTLALDSIGTIANSSKISVGSAGTFDVTGKGFDGLTVANSQEIAGDGLFLGKVSLGNGSIISPGTNVGILSFDGDLLLSPSAVFNFQLGSNTTPGTTYDQIKMRYVTNFGLLDLAGIGFSNFNFTTLEGFGEGTYTLFDSGVTTGSLGSSVEGAIGSLFGTLSTSSGSVLLTVASVPEPGTVGLLVGAAGLAAAASLRRRRR